MSAFRFTVTTTPHGNAYMMCECPSCNQINAYGVTALAVAPSLPCPCGHIVDVTAELYELMLAKLREARRTAPVAQTKH